MVWGNYKKAFRMIAFWKCLLFIIVIYLLPPKSHKKYLFLQCIACLLATSKGPQILHAQTFLALEGPFERDVNTFLISAWGQKREFEMNMPPQTL